MSLCAAGGFHLTKWTSNSRLATIPENEKAKEFKDLDLAKDALPVERLGSMSARNQSEEEFYHL